LKQPELAPGVRLNWTTTGSVDDGVFPTVSVPKALRKRAQKSAKDALDYDFAGAGEQQLAIRREKYKKKQKKTVQEKNK